MHNDTTPEGSQLLPVESAAAWLSLGKTKLWQLIEAGEILTVRVGRRRLVPVRSLRQYTDRLIREAEDEREVRVGDGGRAGSRSSEQ